MVCYRTTTPSARAQACEKPASPLALKGGGLRQVPEGQLGVYRGRKRALSPAQVAELQRRIAAGASKAAIVRALSISLWYSRVPPACF